MSDSSYESMYHNAQVRAHKLQKFKDWVHDYLDAKGIPKEFPSGLHSKEGCRIGDRMDYVFDVLVTKPAPPPLTRARIERAVDAVCENGKCFASQDYLVAHLCRELGLEG